MLRLTAAVATTYLLVTAGGLGSLSPGVIAIIATALASNILIPRVPSSISQSRAFTATLMVVDTAWMTSALLLSGHFGAQFFLVYFFVLFLAGTSESLGLVAIGAVVVAVAYVLTASSGGSRLDVLAPASLVRIPFFLAIATFYSYLVDRVRSERLAARAEAETVANLRQAQAQLLARACRIEQINADLEREIVARQRIEEDLSRANRELLRRDASKSEFVAIVAHELKTPLGCIKNSTEMLRRCRPGSLDADQERFLGLAQRNVHRLTRIVGDLLDLARIEAGLLECDLRPTDLAQLLAELAPSHRIEAEQRRLELVVRVASGLPVVVADGHRIEQIVTNLVGNAMKFTPPGGRIVVEALPLDGSIEVSVADTGIGLSEADQARVFERFYQVPDGHSSSSGSGLGLSIAYHLARRHGSDIRVESRIGTGSRFSFLLPVSLDEAAVAADVDAGDRRLAVV